MKNDLTLNIGTKYNNDGMKKLDNALKTSAKTAGNATRALGAISNELGQMTGAAGKAAQAFSGLFSSVAAGGPMAIAITAITAAVGLLVKAFNNAKQQAKEAAAYMRKGFEDAAEASGRRVQQIMNKLQENLSRGKFVNQIVANDYNIDSRRDVVEIRRNALQERAEAADDIERRRISLKEQRDVDQRHAEDVFTASGVDIANISNEFKQLNAAVDAQASAVQADKTRLENWGKRIDKAGVAEELERLTKAAEDARKTVAEQGGDFVVGTTKRFYANQAGIISSYDVSVTAQDQLEAARQKLEKFEKSNEEAIKDIELYRKGLKELTESQKKLHELIDKRAQASVRLEQARENGKVVALEYLTKLSQLNEKYEEQAKAAREKAEAEQKAAEAEAERIRLRILDEDRQREIQNLEDRRKRLLEQDRQTAVQRLEAHKKEQAAAKALSEAEQKAAAVINQWKVNRQNPFEQWNKVQRDALKDAQNRQKQEEKNIRRAEAAAGKKADSIFNRDGSLRKAANAFDIGRFAEQSDYLGFKNVSEKQLASLQQRRNELRQKLFNDDGTVKKGVNERGQDMGLFRKLDGALNKMDAVKEADKQRAAAEARERKRAENEDKRTRRLESIDAQLQNLVKKVEI